MSPLTGHPGSPQTRSLSPSTDQQPRPLAGHRRVLAAQAFWRISLRLVLRADRSSAGWLEPTSTRAFGANAYHLRRDLSHTGHPTRRPPKANSAGAYFPPVDSNDDVIGGE